MAGEKLNKRYMGNPTPTSQQEITPGAEDEDGMMFDLGEDSISEVEEQSDGSAIVRMEKHCRAHEEVDFYGNLAVNIKDWELGSMA